MLVTIFLTTKSDFTKFINTLNLLSNNIIHIYYTDHNLLREFLNINNNFEFKIYYDLNLKNLKNLSLLHFKNSNEDIFLTIDTNVSLDNLNFLDKLNDSIILGPLIKKKDSLFSNFWGDVDKNGFYKRSSNYIHIFNTDITGIFECKYINSCFAFRKSLINKVSTFYLDNFKSEWDYDATFAFNCRSNNIKMNIINDNTIGYYNNIITIFDYFTDKNDWVNKYFHPLFINFIKTNKLEYNTVCTDAFQFPIFTEIFCEELIQLTEEKKLWSAGKKKDMRIQGGYEHHPTVDVHLNQLNFEKIWKDIVKNYISKVASYLYDGITTKDTNLNFVVKYSVTGQKKLNPHHDASTYTVNIALNNNFKGGGCHFLRQNLKVTDNPIGHSLIHPGKLTHYHAGLEVLEGNRYILVSFIN